MFTNTVHLTDLADRTDWTFVVCRAFSCNYSITCTEQPPADKTQTNTK